MISFNIELGKPNKKNERKIYISVRKDREKRSIPTIFYASEKDLNKKGELANNLILLSVNKKVDGMRQRLHLLGADAEVMPLNALCDRLTNDAQEDDVFELDFFDYGYGIADKMVAEGRDKTAACYRTALATFAKFLQRDHIDINSITKDMASRWMEWFDTNDYGDRARELYMGNIQALHNRAKEEYNDEDADKIVIKRSPFAKIKFKRSRAELRKVTDKAITAEGIRAIANLPHYDNGKSDLVNCRADMARDAFLLSFALCGMNAKDMYDLDKFGKGGKVCFMRSKTKRRSGVDSYTEMSVQSQISAISERNRGRRHAWRWAEVYSSSDNFNSALRHGLNELVEWAEKYYGKSAEELGLKPDGRNLTFGSARSTWATIAANDCGVSTEVVDRCLCHVIDSVAAQSYIHKSFAHIDEANEKVMRFVFGDEVLK